MLFSSCFINLADLEDIVNTSPDYVGTWEHTLDSSDYTTTVDQLKLTESEYTITRITTILSTNEETSQQTSKGTVTEATTTTFILTETVTTNEEAVPVSYQTPITVTWSVTGTDLTLIDDTTDSLYAGTFSK